MRTKLTLLGACVAVLGLAALSPPLFRRSAVPLNYRVVEGWPQLPPSIRFGNVTGVAVDADDRVYVLTTDKVRPDGEEAAFGRVAIFDRQGTFLQAWGENDIKHGHGLRIDRTGDVWVTDIGQHVVTKFSRTGRVLLQLGKPGQAGDGPDQFNKPTDVAFAPSGEFYVADGYGNARVVKHSREGKRLKEWGRRGSAAGEFDVPHGICLDQLGRVFVADRQNLRIQLFTSEGIFFNQWGEGIQPFGLTTTTGGRLFVTDGANNRVWLFDSKGRAIGWFGATGDGPGEFRMAHGIAVDSQGAVYVTDALSDRVQKFVVR